ncbi:MAG TPA: LytTR family DNA-binding domain-containing protein [Puia sp.]
MKELKCLIVDDEPLGIDLVANFLGRLDITNITRCSNGIEAFQRLQQERFDLLFLDIEMPLLSGIDLLKSLSQRPAVVLTTAYRDYAVEGFELEALDYLVKPFSFVRFMQTMEKVARGAGLPAREEMPVTETAGQAGVNEKEFLFLKAGKEQVKILIGEIRYIESRKDYIRVHTTKGEWLCHQSLTDITSRLPGERFFRLHRSYTVALDKIDGFRNNAVHIQGKVIPVSRENRQELRRRLSE